MHPAADQTTPSDLAEIVAPAGGDPLSLHELTHRPETDTSGFRGDASDLAGYLEGLTG